MELVYPDAKRGVRELLNAYGETCLQLPVDYGDHTPIFLVYRAGGTEDPPFRMDRITVDLYTDGSTNGDALADTVKRFLTAQPHEVSTGLLDVVTCETVPVEVPQPAGYPVLVTSTYRVSTRGTRNS